MYKYLCMKRFFLLVVDILVYHSLRLYIGKLEFRESFNIIFLVLMKYYLLNTFLLNINTRTRKFKKVLIYY